MTSWWSRSAWQAALSRLRPRTARARHAVAALGLIGGAALTSVSILATGPAAVPEPHREKAWPVAVLETMPTALSPTFTVYGRVESGQHAGLGSDVNAAIVQVLVHEGDWVQEGDTLVELDDAEARLALAERTAELARQRALFRSIESEQAMLERTLAQARSVNAITEAKLTRHRSLMAQRLISQSQLDDVLAEANRAAIELEAHERRLEDLPNRLAAQRAEVDRTEALAARARLELERTVVRAPFAGPVLEVKAAPGDRNRPGSVLVTLANADAFEIRTQMPDRYEARLQRYLLEGQPVIGVLADGRVLELSRLAHNIRPGQTGIDAFFRPPPGDFAATGLPPLGRVVDLRVELPAEPDVVALPIASLYDNDRVYAVEERRLKAIRVERVGELQLPDGDFRVLVRSPELTGGRTVITTQLPRAISGLLVEPS
jgi:HlyD family secretion protein